jgi:hypothetical protein
MRVYANVEEIMGVKLRYPRPIIDGFRFNSKNGEIISLNYTVEPMEKGYFYKFTPSLKLKGNEEGHIEFHISEDIDEILDIELVAISRTLKRHGKLMG